MLNYEPTFHDEILDPLIQQILPDIEESLKKELMADLQKEAQLEFEKQFFKVGEQALEEYDLALHDLEEEGIRLMNHQTEHLRKQIQRLQKEKKIKEQNHFKQLQDRYVSQNFQSLVLAHPKIQAVQQELGQEILEQSEEKMESVKQRRIRQIAVKMQNKEQKLKAQRDRIIKNEIYQSRSLDDLRKDIEIMKIGVASMKSEYNVKIKKVDQQIRLIKEKSKSIQPKANISDLKAQLQNLQARFGNTIISNPNLAQQNNDPKANDTFSHLDCSDLDMQPSKKSLTDYHQSPNTVEQQQEEDSSIGTESSNQSDQNFEEECVAKPPVYYASEQPSQQNLHTFQNHTPILRLDVASLLRTNWESPLEKYVSKLKDGLQNNSSIETVSNENDPKLCNKQSFQQIYHQHLAKLNQATRRKKLTAETKKAILRNLSIMKRNKY